MDSIINEESRVISIISLLGDEVQTNQLLQVLEKGVEAMSPSVAAFLSGFQNGKNFPSSFLAWIAHQSQPFVTYRGQKHHLSESNPLSTSTSAPLQINGQNMSSSAHPVTTKKPDSEVQKNSSKPKKRMTTNAVPCTPGAIMSGNIASAADTVDAMSPSLRLSEMMKASECNRQVGTEKACTSEVTDSHKTKELPTLDNLMIATVASLDGSRSSDRTQLTKSKGDIVLLHDESFTGEVSSSIGLAVSVRKQGASFTAQMTSSTTQSVTIAQAITRMSAVFSSLVLNQHVTFADAIPLLAKLCSPLLPHPKDTEQVVVKVSESSKFPTLLTSSVCFHQFTVETIENLLSVIKLLGYSVVMGFASSPVMQRLSISYSTH